VVDGKAIDLTEKKLKEEFRANRNDKSIVRSYDNGWVHAHAGLSLTSGDDLESLRKLAVDAISAVGLDFGAVDVLACLDTADPRRLSKAVVCEVNSAPGIENEITKDAYVKAFNEVIAAKQGAAA
jgi:D-alanine-D-alanine ligase-like ATP-grasp enzyme